MILVDENVHSYIISALKDAGIHVATVSELASGIKDDQVIQMALKYDWMLLTQDKDFGEWVFSHHIEGLTVLFLRFSFHEYRDIAHSLVLLLQNPTLERPFFATITTKKIRIRKL
jgi:predicted nuclease of predicted toxin-antitoxin system